MGASHSSKRIGFNWPVGTTGGKIGIPPTLLKTGNNFMHPPYSPYPIPIRLKNSPPKQLGHITLNISQPWRTPLLSFQLRPEPENNLGRISADFLQLLFSIHHLIFENHFQLNHQELIDYPTPGKIDRGLYYEFFCLQLRIFDFHRFIISIYLHYPKYSAPQQLS